MQRFQQRLLIEIIHISIICRKIFNNSKESSLGTKLLEAMHLRFYEIPRVNIISTTAYILQTLFYLLRQFISVRFSKRIARNITQIRNPDKFCRRSIPRTRVLFFLCLPVSALFASLSSASSSQWSVLDTRKMLISRSSLRQAQNKLKQKHGRDKKKKWKKAAYNLAWKSKLKSCWTTEFDFGVDVNFRGAQASSPS